MMSKALPILSGFQSGITSNPGSDPGSVLSRFDTIISGFIAIITIFAGIAFVIYFVLGALTWVSSAGKADQLQKAKSQMSSALIGLIITILTIPVIYIIGQLVGINILNPATIIPLLVAQ